MAHDPYNGRKPGMGDSAWWILFVTLIEVLILGGIGLALWKMC